MNLGYLGELLALLDPWLVRV